MIFFVSKTTAYFTIGQTLKKFKYQPSLEGSLLKKPRKGSTMIEMEMSDL